MGLFNFLNPKKNRAQKALRNFNKMMNTGMNSAFPKREKDINAAANELLYILNNKISHNEAKEIIRKSVGIRIISKDFSKERLRQHLAGYCLHHFTDSQVEEFHNYLSALANIMKTKGSSPSEVRRKGNLYVCEPTMVKQPVNQKPKKMGTRYESARLTFKRDIIEPLGIDDEFNVYVPNDGGSYTMTKRDFHRVFDNVVKSESYKVGGNYNYSKTPHKAQEFFKAH